MASTQEAEIVFAQKLASNEKPVRSKALVKLRKYISARSERAEGFREEELLKIWKGLFYCVWMQDKPLLQEELSTKISGLLRSFRTLDSQFLYFKTFLQTMKREWNGIDRLRMDKFYQLVRFVFREVFEMLKRQQWESRLVTEFLQLFSAQLLHSSSAAPAGLVLHILDLYMTELALVGSAELTAEQNQTFIEPFFKTVAKTKDRVLLKAIGSNIFNTIVDQVPYAIEDLQREIRQNAELDSGEESESQQDTEEMKTTSLSESSQKTADCDEEECLLSDGMDDDDTCGPVLQFDYGAIADRLFAAASHSNIQSFNRSKIYKFVKIFRDLSEGVFPQDEVEKVSSDEDDDDDNRRKKRKRRRQKNKEKKDEESLKKSEAGQSESTAASDDTDTSKDTKQNKKSKKKKKSGLESVEGQQTDPSEQDTTGSAEEKLQSDAESSQCDTEHKHRAHVSTSAEPALKLKKKQRRKRTVLRKTCEKAEEADHCSEMEISVASAEIVTSVPPKKKQKLKKKAKGAESEVTSACLSGSVSAVAPVDVSAATASQTQADSQKTHASRKTPAKKKKQKDVVSDVPETNGEAQEVEPVHTEDQEQPAGRLRTKKSKQKPAAVRIKPERKRRVMEEDEVKPSQVNGHADQTALKRPKTISVLPASKSEIKKVTFGLKNNKTMEFRKMDQSSLLSPARLSRVPFDPKRTPKSGVLKSPTSSPAVMKRAMAADFF
uniref:Ribosomal RNA processing 1 n=1 Tax=Cyprinus carpio TaxID=7962 RepID=A0A8C1TSZ4_CYPCA